MVAEDHGTWLWGEEARERSGRSELSGFVEQMKERCSVYGGDVPTQWV